MYYQALTQQTSDHRQRLADDAAAERLALAATGTALRRKRLTAWELVLGARRLGTRLVAVLSGRAASNPKAATDSGC